jgi:hypothetical protein
MINKIYLYTLIIITVIFLLPYFLGYVFTQNSPIEDQTKNASNDKINKTQNREPTEVRDGGEYSGFEETGVQTKGIPADEDGGSSESTPQAPISDVEIRGPNKEKVVPFNVTNAIGRSFNQSDTDVTANTTLQTNNQ